MRKDIGLEKQLLATTRKKVDISQESERQLRQKYEDSLRDGADSEASEELRMKLSQARQRLDEGRREFRDRVNRIDELQARYATLQSEQIVALQDAEGIKGVRSIY